MELAEDYDLGLRLSEITQIIPLNKALYYYRIDDSNLTRRQIDLINWSAVASRRAIERRGLTENYELDVQIIGRFSLRRKGNAPD